MQAEYEMVAGSGRRNIRQAYLLRFPKRLFYLRRIVISGAGPRVPARVAGPCVNPVIQAVSYDVRARERPGRSEPGHDHNRELETLRSMHSEHPDCRLVAFDD